MDARKQLPKGQKWYKPYLKQRGYPHKGGKCHGLSYAWVQAELLGEVPVFDERLYLLYSIPPASFNDTMQAAKIKQITIVDKAKNDAMKKLGHFDMKNPSKVKKFNALTNQLIRKRSDKVTLAYLDMDPFFEIITLCQEGNNLEEFYDKRKLPRGQNGAISLQTAMSDKLEKKGGIVKLNQFSGVYTLDELEQYFYLLRNILEQNKNLKDPFPLILNSTVHTISVSYDKKNKRWKFFDAEKQPTMYFDTDRAIARAVLKALSRNKIAVFETLIHSTWDCTNHRVAIQSWKNEVKKLLPITLARANQLDSSNASWLSIAAENGHVHVVKKLLALKGIDPQKLNSKAQTPLYLAVLNNKLKTVKALLKHNEIDPNVMNPSGKTLLYIAALRNNVSIASLLLKHKKCKPNQSDKVGNTPLHVACKEGNLSVVHLLLRDNRVKRNQRNKYGNSPLYIAVNKGHFAIVQSLLNDKKIKPDRATGYHYTPLSRAILRNDVKMVALLLENKKINPNKTIKFDNTPLILAIQLKLNDIVNLLLNDERTNPNLTSSLGETPLYVAARLNNIEAVKALLCNRNTNLQPSEILGLSPLKIAVNMQHTEIVDLLIAAINEKNKPDKAVNKIKRSFLEQGFFAAKKTDNCSIKRFYEGHEMSKEIFNSTFFMG